MSVVFNHRSFQKDSDPWKEWGRYPETKGLCANLVRHLFACVCQNGKGRPCTFLKGQHGVTWYILTGYLNTWTAMETRTLAVPRTAWSKWFSGLFGSASKHGPLPAKAVIVRLNYLCTTNMVGPQSAEPKAIESSNPRCLPSRKSLILHQWLQSQSRFWEMIGIPPLVGQPREPQKENPS